MKSIHFALAALLVAAAPAFAQHEHEGGHPAAPSRGPSAYHGTPHAPEEHRIIRGNTGALRGASVRRTVGDWAGAVLGVSGSTAGFGALRRTTWPIVTAGCGIPMRS
jgi:hypothetical protein